MFLVPLLNSDRAHRLSACISSIMHLITSIQFSEAEDKTYHYGLILWW